MIPYFDPDQFKSFQSVQGTKAFHDAFCAYLKAHDPEQMHTLLAYQAGTLSLDAVGLSEWLIELASVVDDYITAYFGLENARSHLEKEAGRNRLLANFKYQCIKKALKAERSFGLSWADCHQRVMLLCQRASIPLDDCELAMATLFANASMNDDQAALDALVDWCQSAIADRSGRAFIASWWSFALPSRLDYQHLLQFDTAADGHMEVALSDQRHRDGFDLTDPRMTARESGVEAHYCVDCHEQVGDFCQTGFPVKKKDPSLGFKKNPLGELLTGCPVEERISEMHVLYKRGRIIAALAMAMRDNPLCALTGHRICNECMKSCIYQKQTPVNIPQIESSLLTQVLHLPWGVEIYDLLMRWNPLRPKQWLIQAQQGRRIAVMGMGPAGISLSHHLLMDGYNVVGMDGLKIEPLPQHFLDEAIRDFNAIKRPLSKRLPYGFGGVAEYGITNRWDKNFLTLVYIVLMRREGFALHGGVRFGGTLTIEDAWALGFDHLAIAVGAGLPRALPVPHAMAPGMRQANDFLMALLLSDATQADSVSAMQVELPAVVIGGGLTAVDAATECQAYYVLQVERLLTRYESLEAKGEAQTMLMDLSDANRASIHRMLGHARAIREERMKAEKAGRAPSFTSLLHGWGGVTIVYRRTMAESPAYQRNHDELQKALDEGVMYREQLRPQSVVLDEHGHCKALACASAADTTIELPARTILVATGAQTNVAYAFEHRGSLLREGFEYQSFQQVDGALKRSEHQPLHCKDTHHAPLTSYQQEGFRVSFLGDTHPMYHGNVVKAIASGKRLAEQMDGILSTRPDANERPRVDLGRELGGEILSMTPISNEQMKMIIHSPWLSKKHELGQFYRVQNFFQSPIQYQGQYFNTKALALRPIAVDRTAGTLTFVLDGDSLDALLAQSYRPGQRVHIMGPNGNRHHVLQESQVVFIGGRKAWQLMLSLSEMLVQNEVTWLRTQSCMMHDADLLGGALRATHDLHEADASLKDTLNAHASLLAKADRIYVVGDADLIRLMQCIRQSSPGLSKPQWVAHVDVPMQCMLKGVCAQCLVWQKDEQSGERSKAVYACSWQDQPMELIDPLSVDERQQEQSAMQKFNMAWFDHAFDSTHK